MCRLALLLVALAPGCVSFTWTRDARFAPPRRGAIETIEVGQTTFGESLARLGAPLYVWEYKGDGAALAWGWDDVDAKYVSVSIPIQEQVSPSLSYGDEGADLNGVVLLFDRDLKLEMVRTGRLRELRAQLGRKRPAAESSGESSAEPSPVPPPE